MMRQPKALTQNGPTLQEYPLMRRIISLSLLFFAATSTASAGEIKTAEASDENRAAACSKAGKQLQNDIGVRVGTQKLIALGSCDCSKNPDGNVYKGHWTCIVSGTFEDK